MLQPTPCWTNTQRSTSPHHWLYVSQLLEQWANHMLQTSSEAGIVWLGKCLYYLLLGYFSWCFYSYWVPISQLWLKSFFPLLLVFVLFCRAETNVCFVSARHTVVVWRLLLSKQKFSGSCNYKDIFFITLSVCLWQLVPRGLNTAL